MTQKLRASEELATVPIVQLTASVQEASVDRGYESGADDYIKKPFAPKELLDRVAAALGDG